VEGAHLQPSRGGAEFHISSVFEICSQWLTRGERRAILFLQLERWWKVRTCSLHVLRLAVASLAALGAVAGPTRGISQELCPQLRSAENGAQLGPALVLHGGRGSSCGLSKIRAVIGNVARAHGLRAGAVTEQNIAIVAKLNLFPEYVSSGHRTR
jgi:hypothetical protein